MWIQSILTYLLAYIYIHTCSLLLLLPLPCCLSGPAKAKRRPSAPNGRCPSPLTGANSCTSLPAKLTETCHSRPPSVDPFSPSSPSSPSIPQVCVRIRTRLLLLLCLHLATSSAGTWPWPKDPVRPLSLSPHTRSTHQHFVSMQAMHPSISIARSPPHTSIAFHHDSHCIHPSTMALAITYVVL